MLFNKTPLTIEEIRENNEIELYYINRIPENFISHFIYEFADITAYIAFAILLLI
jgi:hypothetical protein